MGALDIIFILLALAIVGLGIYTRFIKALFLLIAIYIGTLTAALGYRQVSLFLKAIGEGIRFESLMFIITFLLVTLVLFLIAQAAYSDTTLPKLGVLDYLLGGIVGLAGAVLITTVIYGGLGLMISEQWEPYEQFSSIYNLYVTSGLGVFLKQLLSGYAYAFYPFFAGTGYPPVFLAP